MAAVPPLPSVLVVDRKPSRGARRRMMTGRSWRRAVTGAWHAYTRAALMSDPLAYAALVKAELAAAEESVVEVPVLVVGAGPTGLTASILLSRWGIPSLTVEKHPGTTI